MCKRVGFLEQAGPKLINLNIFYCQILYSNGVGSQVLTTLVTTLPRSSSMSEGGGGGGGGGGGAC